MAFTVPFKIEQLPHGAVDAVKKEHIAHICSLLADCATYPNDLRIARSESVSRSGSTQTFSETLAHPAAAAAATLIASFTLAPSISRLDQARLTMPFIVVPREITTSSREPKSPVH